MAQSSGQPGSSCKNSLYEDEFSCARLKAESYCNFSAKVGRDDAEYNLYEEVYCNLAEGNDDEIYKILAKQFKAENPKMNAKTIESILQNPTIYTGDSYGTLSSDLYRRVRASYNREKITYQTKESLKQEFKFAEMWADGTLRNSPFDLITDLNLIEIILFGRMAEWKDDVYSWPKEKTEDDSNKKDNNSQKGQVPGDSQKNDSPSNNPSDNTQNDDPIDQFECVPEDSADENSDKDSDNDSKEGVAQRGCGNGIKEGNEECDDGNQKSGDGCSNTCKSEEGATLSCTDNDAITFKKFTIKDSKKGNNKDSGNSSATNNHDELPITCPPGSKAVKKPALTKNIILKQPKNYPGPFVGGVLKNFPKSKKGKCPPGSKYTEISIFGKSEGTCIPHEFCTPDFKPMRKKLFGEGYEKNPAKVKAAEAIEASVCVKFTKVNRPESPYPVTDGCIDCHIRAMNDSMAKLLEKNVAPLENSMQSWGTSNRWGPSVSFDLNVLVGRGINAIFTPEYDRFTAKEKADKYIKQSQQKASNKLDPNKEQAKPTTVGTVNLDQLHNRYQLSEELTKIQSKFAKSNYKITADASADQVVHAGLINKLRELKESFKRIQEKYVNISLGITLHQKKQCTF